MFLASQENSISRPNALYFSDHRDRSGLSSRIWKTNSNIMFLNFRNLKAWLTMHILIVIHNVKIEKVNAKFRTWHGYVIYRLITSKSMFDKVFVNILNYKYIETSDVKVGSTCGTQNVWRKTTCRYKVAWVFISNL